jgi:hypothetical protein
LPAKVPADLNIDLNAGKSTQAIRAFARRGSLVDVGRRVPNSAGEIDERPNVSHRTAGEEHVESMADGESRRRKRRPRSKPVTPTYLQW